MPESIISQFRREYNSPIETDRQVNNINARDAINILTRWEGMNVYVISEGITYSLVGGLDNTNWQAVAGIGEAPIDGASYVRKDGGWELMPEVPSENYESYIANVFYNGVSFEENIFKDTFNTPGWVWVRDDVGSFSVISNGSISLNKIFITASFINGNSTMTSSITVNVNISNNSIKIDTWGGVNRFDNPRIFIEIRQYP